VPKEMWLERKRERKKKRSLVSSPNLSLNLDRSNSIVSIVGGMFIRKSFPSRGSERRERLRSGQTRRGTTFLMVCLSLVCQFIGQRLLCIQFRLGEIGKLKVVLVLLAEDHRSDRSG
jgi:hypothetical protein